MSADPINASTTNNTVPVGTVLVAKTNIGNYAKIRIDYYPIPINVTIVYQDDGSPAVPEIPYALLRPLFIITTLLAVVAYRRKCPSASAQA